jgi:predicted butyrate kinase (DUF1464 family)
MTIEKWLADVHYDNLGTCIWNREKDGGNQMIADIRGWGAIQNEFKTNEEAEKFQDEVGEFIVQAIKEKLASTSSQTISDAGKDTADYIDRHIIESMKELAKEGFKPQTSEISDEEIEKGAKEWYNKEGAYSASAIALKTWVYAIRWYREQLKK